VTSGYLPLGALMVGDRVADVLIDKGGEFFHGFTYSGHPASCAVGVANLTAMRDEGVVPRVRDVLAPYWARRWAELGEHPLVGEARSLGLFGAIELVPNKPSRQFFPNRGEVGVRGREIVIRNGLIMRAVWDTLIVAPPLVISTAEIDALLSIVVRSLDELHQDLRRDGLA
jgi:putrescine aminotransferase